MANLKARGLVLKRDDRFAARLDVAKPVDAPQPPEKPAPKPSAKKSAEAITPRPKPADTPQDKPAKPPISAPITASEPEAASQISAPAAARKTTEDMKAPVEAGRGPKVKLRATFRCPSDLAERATAWAEKARCPVSAVFRKAMGELRPQLIERIEAGIEYSEVPSDRMTDASHPFDTSMMISQAAYDRLVKEIDPEAMTGVEAPMSRWVRAQFLPHFDAWLTSKGQ
ncbi:hypothetical protein SAMN05421538_11261 [Paracoccus isoporae]|uniref:Uncharacterized protein n=1 Tax=Paracoccus isoporae TaxID=591205 RepID=A0A1G7G5F5_9RHOB|nr:hypothetical protein [Paracoccus isoporae]SDE83386.1 hypothetical protein SAMN05421538_11261 [Paracoccus isoporae]